MSSLVQETFHDAQFTDTLLASELALRLDHNKPLVVQVGEGDAQMFIPDMEHSSYDDAKRGVSVRLAGRLLTRETFDHLNDLRVDLAGHGEPATVTGTIPRPSRVQQIINRIFRPEIVDPEVPITLNVPMNTHSSSTY